MNRSINLTLSLLLLPILIVSFLIFLPSSHLFQIDPKGLSTGIILDLLITVPALYYLVIRKSTIPKITTLYIFILGIFIAGFILPPEQQYLIKIVQRIAIPAVEIGIISIVLYKLYRIRSTYRNSAEEASDFYDNLTQACTTIFDNRLGYMLASEIAVVYYLFSPKKTKGPKSSEFTTAKTSGIQTTIMVLLVLILVETFVVHIWTSTWSETVAWILTAISIYTIIQILSILRSLNARYTQIDQNAGVLSLRYGFGSQAIIPIDDIDRIELSQRRPSSDSKHVNLSVFDIVDGQNIIIYTRSEQTLQKIYGIKKTFTSIGLYLDDKQSFVTELQETLSKNNA